MKQIHIYSFRVRLLTSLVAGVVVSSCTSGTITGPDKDHSFSPGPSSDPGASAVDYEGPTTWTVGEPRAGLGAEGKPLVDTATGRVVGDELLVRFARSASPAEIGDAVRAEGGVVSHFASRTGYHVVRFADAAATSRAAQGLRKSELVSDVLYNHVCAGTGIGTSPTLELGRLQWNLYAMTLDPFAKRPSAKGVTIAILDTGVAYEDHSDAKGVYARAPDLSAVEFGPGYDFVNDDAHPNDDQRHGTHVAGVIAATSGVASVVNEATLLPIKVLDSANLGTELGLAEGLYYAADHGADVINMSLSFPPTYFPSHILQAAVDYAAQAGVLMVAAAGNHAEPIVSYPAAFRDVLAVGASDLPEWYFTLGDPDEQWDNTLDFLQRAPYSDHSYKLDVMAPAGTISGDANFDGKPEAVLAQTFAPGDPTAFGYYFYAGTSQAAAQVSALAAALLAENPALTPFQVRALLTENAKRMGWSFLSSQTGRGAVRAHKTLAAAKNKHATDPRARYFSNVGLTLHDRGGGDVIARAHVELMDQAGNPVKYAKLYGLFTGAAFQSVIGLTNTQGVVEFDSAPLAGNLLVGFQVDAAVQGMGQKAAFDRPRGFLRIDAFSLLLLSLFGQQVMPPDNDGVIMPANASAGPASGASGPGGGPGGSGIGTSPNYPLPIDPARTPITVAFDPALFAGTQYRPTLLLPNFSWGLSTSPMAVAADEAWFLATFPGAAERRVLSYGKGYGSSPLRFDRASFPTPIITDDDLPPVPISLVLLTFNSGTVTAKSLETSTSMWVDTTYSGISASLADEYETVFSAWYASATGIGTSPNYTANTYSFDQSTFDFLSALSQSYLAFAPTYAATPAGAYQMALGAASMPVAPVMPEADGRGMGTSALP